MFSTSQEKGENKIAYYLNSKVGKTGTITRSICTERRYLKKSPDEQLQEKIERLEKMKLSEVNDEIRKLKSPKESKKEK